MLADSHVVREHADEASSCRALLSLLDPSRPPKGLKDALTDGYGSLSFAGTGEMNVAVELKPLWIRVND